MCDAVLEGSRGMRSLLPALREVWPALNSPWPVLGTGDPDMDPGEATPTLQGWKRDSDQGQMLEA